MNDNEFILLIAAQFDSVPLGNITMETDLTELEEWSSLTGLSILSAIQKSYGIRLFYKEIMSVHTVKQLFDITRAKHGS